MIRLLALAVLSAAVPAIAGEPPAELRPLLEESDTYPQDYGAAVRLARAAAGVQAHDYALVGWERAAKASGGNLVTALGTTMAKLGLEDGAGARRSAAEATSLAPESSVAWTTRAWALRNATGLAPAPFYLLASEAAYTRANRIDPSDREAACGLAWNRLLLGDRVGARLAFGRLVEADLGHLCAMEGGAAAAPKIRFGGAASVTGTGASSGDISSGGSTPPVIAANAALVIECTGAG